MIAKNILAGLTVLAISLSASASYKIIIPEGATGYKWQNKCLGEPEAADFYAANVNATVIGKLRCYGVNFLKVITDSGEYELINENRAIVVGSESNNCR